METIGSFDVFLNDCPNPNNFLFLLFTALHPPPLFVRPSGSHQSSLPGLFPLSTFSLSLSFCGESGLDVAIFSTPCALFRVKPLPVSILFCSFPEAALIFRAVDVPYSDSHLERRLSTPFFPPFPPRFRPFVLVSSIVFFFERVGHLFNLPPVFFAVAVLLDVVSSSCPRSK